MQKDQRVSGKRSVTDDVKFNLISLIIELGNPRYGLAKMFGLGQTGLYDRFLTGKSTVNRDTMSLLMVLIDFGVGLDMPEALDLHENLFKFCGEFGSKKKKEEEEEEVSAVNDTDWPSVLERKWANRLVEVFHNMKNTPSAPNFALCHLLFKFNKVGFFICCVQCVTAVILELIHAQSLNITGEVLLLDQNQMALAVLLVTLNNFGLIAYSLYYM